MNFERLYFLREENDLKQTELASLMGVKQVNISNWENTKEIIPLYKLNFYANYFGVNMDYIVKISDTRVRVRKNLLDKEKIGNNLKLIRKEFSLTQTQLADLLNTSHSTISAYEAGKTMILTAFAVQICKTYGISLDWLCGKSDKKYVR